MTNSKSVNSLTTRSQAGPSSAVLAASLAAAIRCWGPIAGRTDPFVGRFRPLLPVLTEPRHSPTGIPDGRPQGEARRVIVASLHRQQMVLE